MNREEGGLAVTSRGPEAIEGAGLLPLEVAGVWAEDRDGVSEPAPCRLEGPQLGSQTPLRVFSSPHWVGRVPGARASVTALLEPSPPSPHRASAASGALGQRPGLLSRSCWHFLPAPLLPQASPHPSWLVGGETGDHVTAPGGRAVSLGVQGAADPGTWRLACPSHGGRLPMASGPLA